MEKEGNNTGKNPFGGCTIVVTGQIKKFTRDGMGKKIVSLDATADSSVTRKTGYLACGKKAGSKLVKAKELGIPILIKQEFPAMILK